MKILMALAVAGAFALVLPQSATAQPAPATQQGNTIKRTILQRADVPGSNMEVITAIVEIKEGTKVGRHVHPGIVFAYVLDGGDYTLILDGQPPKAFKPGESFRIENAAVHDEHTGSQPAKLLAVFTVEKGKPLATPVQ